MDDLQQDFLRMNETAQTPAPSRSNRKAKTPEQKIADLELKQAQIAERIKDQKAVLTKEKRRKDTRRKIVAGAIALEHMEHDENFKQVMEGLLKKHVKKSDLDLFEI